MKSETSQEWETVQEKIVTCRKCSRLVAWREEVARTRRRAYRDEDYWGKPVPGFGDRDGRVLIVGLAPAAHGANRTGRPFTGDKSGNFLYSALYQAGFASQPTSTRVGDGLTLQDLYIAAVCRCAPPGNLPTREEIANCLPHLAAEMGLMENLQVIVALGHIAFENTLRLFDRQAPGLRKLDRPKFAHGAVYSLGERIHSKIRDSSTLSPSKGAAHEGWPPEQRPEPVEGQRPEPVEGQRPEPVEGQRPELAEGLPWLVASYHPSQQNTQTGRLTREMFAGIWDKVREMIS